MSILRSNMSKPLFHEFKKQASFYLKEKIKTARLALTDVTQPNCNPLISMISLAEEATNGDPGGPDAQTLKLISRSAFELDDYWRIVEILHKRLVRFERRFWRESYKAVVVLEYLMTHGPGSVADEFQTDRDVIKEMENFQHVDERGFNWGETVREKAERVLKLLEKGPLLKEERDRARKISRGIQGFGSFHHRTSSGQGTQHESSSLKTFDRCNSQFNDHANHEDVLPEEGETKGKAEKQVNQRVENFTSSVSIPTGGDSKENLVPNQGLLLRELSEEIWFFKGESNPLLDDKKDESRINLLTEDHHPFDDAEHLTNVSLL
ncbi:ENTH/VHS family protein [Dorcoceras hygrometricum]|uniref:ENTH/VHS family protein n=1 Tax=Dorcoceras hygrometricum TaxID=472368 RepID=A0A2Z7BK52_9LAMI|nr:ENTH/VHS family protein [Dorcoceras hygrometricum]